MAADKGPENDKLKELEASIAKELDQKVTLSQPSDPRLDGTVAMNPTLNTSKPETVISTISKTDTVIPTGPTPGPTVGGVPASGVGAILDKPINSDRKVEDITLEEVDSLLNEIDEGFGGKLNELKSEVGQLRFAQNLESISISADYLKDEKDDGETESAIKISDSVELTEDLFETDEESIKGIGKSFWRYLRAAVVSLALLPVDVTWRAVFHVWKSKKNPPKQIFQELWGALKPAVTKRTASFQEFFEHLISYPPLHYVKLILLVILIWALRYVVVDITHNLHPQTVKDPFLKTFEEVAGDKKNMSEDVQDNKNIPIPEFVVTIPRIVAALHTDTPKKHPMVATEIFIEASDREAAVEISKRQTEMRDNIARILEQMTFAELDTLEGKDKLKLRIRLATNRLLNNGRAKQVFFKSIQIHE